MKRTTLTFLLIAGLVAVSPSGIQLAEASAKHTVTLLSNAGDGSSKVVTTTSTSLKLPHVTFSRVGYDFLGWAKTSGGAKVYSDRATLRIAANLKLYAVWREISPTAPTVFGHTVGALIWHDEFRGANGSSINSNFWTARFCGPYAANGGGTCHNAEPQYYLPSEVALDGQGDGNAVITTKRISSAPAQGTCWAPSCQFTSARFDTQGKVEFQYGYIETRIQMPAGGRNWPAFWMLGENITSVGWPQSGEIDIAEQGGNNPHRDSGAVHYSTSGIANDCCGNHLYDYGDYTGPDYSADYHTYAMAWTPNQIQLLVDGNVFHTFTSSSIRSQYWSFNNPFFLIINNATGDFGGAWTGWMQSQMKIDYVRVWKIDNQGQVYYR